VMEILNDDEDKVIAQTIISMAHSLGMKVVAEGVETKDHLEFLRTNGCDEYQGFLFSPPVPASEFEALLIENYQQLNNRGIDRQVSDIHPHFSTRTASSTLSILN